MRSLIRCHWYVDASNLEPFTECATHAALAARLIEAEALLRVAKAAARHPDYDWDADFLRDIDAFLGDKA